MILHILLIKLTVPSFSQGYLFQCKECADWLAMSLLHPSYTGDKATVGSIAINSSSLFAQISKSMATIGLSLIHI